MQHLCRIKHSQMHKNPPPQNRPASKQQDYLLQPTPFNLPLLALPQVNKPEVTAKDHII